MVRRCYVELYINNLFLKNINFADTDAVVITFQNERSGHLHLKVDFETLRHLLLPGIHLQNIYAIICSVQRKIFTSILGFKLRNAKWTFLGPSPNRQITLQMQPCNHSIQAPAGPKKIFSTQARPEKEMFQPKLGFQIEIIQIHIKMSLFVNSRTEIM